MVSRLPDLCQPAPYFTPTVTGADYVVPIRNIAGWINANDPGGGRLWHKRRLLVESWRMSGCLHAERAGVPPLYRIHVIAELCFKDKRRRDPGNWYPTVKAAVDGLVDAHVLPDDSARYLVGPDLRLGNPVKTDRGLLVLHVFALPPLDERDLR